MFTSTMDREFLKNFLISCGIHTFLLLSAFLGGKLFLKVFNNNNHIEIIRSSVRVDVVGMPKFTVQELKAIQKDVVQPLPEETKGAAESKVKEVEDVIKKDDLVIKEEGKKKSTDSFLSLVSDYSNKKVAPKEKKKGVKAGTSQELNSLILEGNRLSKGSSLVGEFSDQEHTAFSAYVQSLPEMVRRFWKLPSYLKEQNLKCRIAVYLSASGEVLKTELVESSGQSEFDARAEKSIREAAPYPRPTSEVATRLATSGIILRFPL
jgi:colicin import membrane protein